MKKIVRCTWLAARRLGSRVLLVLPFLAHGDASATINDHQPAIERVQQIRDKLLKNDRQSRQSDPIEQAQWQNWPNWPNYWNNWRDWRDWRDYRR